MLQSLAFLKVYNIPTPLTHGSSIIMQIRFLCPVTYRAASVNTGKKLLANKWNIQYIFYYSTKWLKLSFLASKSWCWEPQSERLIVLWGNNPLRTLSDVRLFMCYFSSSVCWPWVRPDKCWVRERWAWTLFLLQCTSRTRDQWRLKEVVWEHSGCKMETLKCFISVQCRKSGALMAL